MNEIENPLKVSIRERVRHLIDTANSLFVENFKYPNVDFDLTGTTAGKYFVKGNRISFNWTLAKNNSTKFLDTTVPHEVVHSIVFHKYKNAKAHGEEFKRTGAQLGFKLTTCHNYDTSSLPNRFKWFCACENGVTVGKNVHNKMINGQARKCNKCKQELKQNKTSIVGARSSSYNNFKF